MQPRIPTVEEINSMTMEQVEGVLLVLAANSRRLPDNILVPAMIAATERKDTLLGYTVHWHYDDDVETWKEGFGLFLTDEDPGEFQFQPLADPDDVCAGAGFKYTGPNFSAVPDAMTAAAQHCQKLADQGHAASRKLIEFLIERKAPDAERMKFKKNW